MAMKLVWTLAGVQRQRRLVVDHDHTGAIGRGRIVLTTRADPPRRRSGATTHRIGAVWPASMTGGPVRPRMAAVTIEQLTEAALALDAGQREALRDALAESLEDGYSSPEEAEIVRGLATEARANPRSGEPWEQVAVDLGIQPPT